MTVGNIKSVNFRGTTEVDDIKGMPDSYAKYRLLSEKIGDKAEFKGKNVSFGKIPGGTNWWRNAFEKFADGLSDANSAVVTFVGTAFVAPIFIVFNPIAEFFNKRQPADPKDTRTPEQKQKDDRNQRIYSAWRQPVSAIIALGGQLALTKHLEKFLDKYADKGYFNVPNNTEGIQELYSKLNVINHNSFYENIAQHEAEARGQNLSHKEKVARRKELIEAHKQNEIERILNGEKAVAERDMIEKALAGLDPDKPETYSILVDDSLKDSVAEDLERDAEFMKTVKNIDDEKFKEKRNKIANERVKTTVSVEEEIIKEWQNLNEDMTTKKELCEQIGNIPNTEFNNQLQTFSNKKVITKAELLEQLKECIDNKKKEITKQINGLSENELEEMFKEHAVDTKEKLLGKLESKEESVYNELSKKSEENIRNKVLEMKLRNSEAVKGLIEKAKDEPATLEIIEDTVKKVSKFSGKTRDMFLNAKDVKKAVLENKYIRTGLDYVKNHYKNRRMALVIFGNLLTLPITCTILNWVYPKIANRIMGVDNPKAKKQPVKPEKSEEEPVYTIQNKMEENTSGKAGV